LEGNRVGLYAIGVKIQIKRQNTLLRTLFRRTGAGKVEDPIEKQKKENKGGDGFRVGMCECRPGLAKEERY